MKKRSNRLMKKNTKINKQKNNVPFVEKMVYLIALMFVFVLPFSLLYIESQKLEIADQTEKTKIALGKERNETSKHEVKLSTVHEKNTQSNGKVTNEQAK